MAARGPSLDAVSVIDDSFEPEAPARESERLTLDLDGWEGPLDLLLTLARAQKVDLSKISILALVEQYLAFIADARKLKLEIAADYLVMAAWLAYLKSRLLLPEPQTDGDEPTGEEMAALLAFRLQRLEAMRDGVASGAVDAIGRGIDSRACALLQVPDSEIVIGSVEDAGGALPVGHGSIGDVVVVDGDGRPAPDSRGAERKRRGRRREIGPAPVESTALSFLALAEGQQP